MDEEHAAPPRPRSVAVLGGGLAGLAASRALAASGHHVTLVERRRFLGGRAFSFHDEQSGWEVDNGQHLFMGCCTAYLDLLSWAGTRDRAHLQPRLKVEVVRDGTSGTIASTPALGPLHILPSFLRYPHLSAREKLLAAYALLRMRNTDRIRDRERLDAESAYDWLRRHHQSERAIANLWNLIIVPALNDDARAVSAEMALMVFQEGLLRTPADAALGWSRVGLTSLAGEPAHAKLSASGHDVLVGETVRSLRIGGGRVTGVELGRGRVIEAEAYVSALPFDVLLEVLPPDVASDPFFSRARGLSFAPIVGVHLWYDRTVMDGDFVAFLNSPVQFVFNKSAMHGAPAGDGQYVCISLSAAWDFAEQRAERLEQIFSREMERLFPRAREARIRRCRVVKQPQATFRPRPGSARCRLPQATPIPNLVLAGEWTDTGWPSTMEGAVRSGTLAADRVDAEHPVP